MEFINSILATVPSEPWYKQEGCAGSSAIPYMAGTILFAIGVYCAESYLDRRQREMYKVKDFPVPLSDNVGRIDKNAEKGGTLLLPKLQEKFAAAQSYGLDKIQFGMIHSCYSLLESLGFLVTGFLPYAWDLAARIGAEQLPYGYKVESEIGVTLLFLVLVQLLGLVTELPFELYSTFQIEKKHGFNKQTLGLFIKDKIISTLLTFAIGGPFVSLLLWIIRQGGQHFFFYVWIFMFLFSVFMMTILPVVIMPLFNKYEPLPDSPLKTSIYELADRLNYPLKKLFVVDGSKRSSHSNAYMYGFGRNKRIVLYDTLLTQVKEGEVLAILGHELGHWKLGHTVTNFVVSQVYTGVSFYCFSLCYNSAALYEAFGFDGSRVPTMIALLLFFQTLWAPVDKLLSFLMTVHSRHCEFGADAFSVELGMSKDLQAGLCKIQLENLGAMCPDRLYSAYHYSHPPLVERLSAMMAQAKKSL